MLAHAANPAPSTKTASPVRRMTTSFWLTNQFVVVPPRNRQRRSSTIDVEQRTCHAACNEGVRDRVQTSYDYARKWLVLSLHEARESILVPIGKRPRRHRRITSSTMAIQKKPTPRAGEWLCEHAATGGSSVGSGLGGGSAVMGAAASSGASVPASWGGP